MDFLDKPVPGSKVSFTAQVVLNPEKKTPWSLKGDEFVYFSKPAIVLPEREDLSEEEALLAEADGSYLPLMGYSGKAVVSQVNQNVDLDTGTGTYLMELNKEWLTGGRRYAVDVQGVLIDANGREQRASQTVTLDESKQKLAITLAKRVFATDETITLQSAATDENGAAVRGSSTVVAMKLSAGQVSYITPYDYGYPYLSSRSYRRQPAGMVTTSSNPRTMVTAAAFQGDKAELKLSEPGAYKLVVVTQLGGGKSMTNEVGCVVRDPEELPGLVLTTNQREYAAGDMLEGELQSRFTDAKVLLTLRDSMGVRTWKPIQMTGQVEKLRVRLPEDLRYACDVAVQYMEGDGRVHIADQLIRVRPAHRFIDIKTDLKDQVTPGETVKLKFAVNRTEPVDLVVSVF